MQLYPYCQTKEVQGNAIPPIARCLENRICAWQVKGSVLEENPHWKGKRVAPSGKAWGDDEDPADDDHRKIKGKRRADDHSGQQNPKRRRPAVLEGKEELAQATEALQKLAGDKSKLDAMFSF